ncbi:MAG: response regulator transcription factor [Gammaproteobacteria bacterium]|nr:response regulator transcription factor [Gammaproteobacteria bacterium]
MKILLADDHALVREGFKHVLQLIGGQPVEVLEATDYPQVFGVLKTWHDIELVVLDLNMPGMPFLDGVRKIRADYPTIPLVVLSATEEPGIVGKAMGYGINGYLLCAGKTNKQIARTLNITERTVKSHVTSVLQTLRVGNHREAAQQAVELNFSVE